MLFTTLKKLIFDESPFAFYGLLAFSLVVSLIELIGISAIAPFIAIATNIDLIAQKPLFAFLYQTFLFESAYDFLFAFGVGLVFFYIFRAVINGLYQHVLARFVLMKHHRLVCDLFVKYLGMPYEAFLQKHPTHLQKTIIQEAQNCSSLLGAFLLMVNEIFVFLFIYSVLLVVNAAITGFLSLVMGGIGWVVLRIVSQAIKHQGKQREQHQEQLFEIIAKALRNFKALKLCSSSPKKDFLDASLGYVHANINNQTLFYLPRLLFEGAGFCVMIIVMLFLLAKQTDMNLYFALLSLYALAFYRLLPSLYRILDAYHKILFHLRSLEIIAKDLALQTELLGEDDLVFKEKIVLKDLSFGYGKQMILKHIHLEIPKGSKVAFVGDSGIGKSTLIDLIVSLLKPKYGKILIDNKELTQANYKSWRAKVGYVPQEIYLFCGSVAENVVFGREWDEAKLIQSLKMANIDDFLCSKEGLHTQIKEGGMNISGGQKQRIGIARALYGNPSVLVLDEATSLLDFQTAQKIMNELLDCNKTLLIITHHLQTIKHCDAIYKIKNQQLVQL